jgi:hypothetical protein
VKKSCPRSAKWRSANSSLGAPAGTIAEEWLMPNVENKVDSSQSQMGETLHRFVEGFSSPRRSPVLHSPSERGLDYEDVSFLARDGVPLEGWFIPAPGSSKMIIANHPLASAGRASRPTCSRGTQTGRLAATDSKSTWYPTTRSCTTPGTTFSPTTCAITV